MANIPNIQSPHDDSALNTHNRTIDTVNQMAQRMKDLVANGQLTPAQYAELIRVINGNIRRGEATFDDIDINKGKLLPRHISEEVLSMMTGDAPINAVPADGSLTTEKYADSSVSPEKLSEVVRQGMYDNAEDLEWRVGSLSNGEDFPSTHSLVSDYIEIEKAYIAPKADTESFVAVYDATERDFVHTLPSADAIKNINEHCFVRIVIRYIDRRTITENNRSELIEKAEMSLVKKPETKIWADDLAKDIKSFLGYRDFHGTDFEWEIGSITSATGEPGTIATHLIRTKNFIELQRGTQFNIPSDRRMMVYLYKMDGSYIRRILYTDHFTITDNHLIKITLGFSSDNDLNESDIENLAQGLRVTTPKKWELENMSTDISAFFNKDILYGEDINWEVGSLHGSTGELGTTSEKRIRSDFLAVDRYTFVQHPAYDFMVYEYDSNYNYVGNNDSKWFKDEYRSSVDGFIKILIRYSDNRDLVSDDIAILSNEMSLKRVSIEGITDSSSGGPGQFILTDDISGLYNSASIENVSNLNTMRADDVYALYDELMVNHSNYITTKEDLGVVDGEHIYLYKFKPHTLDSNLPIKLLNIKINSGLHGNEKHQVIVLYNFLKKVCENWRDDKFLEFFRYNVEFEIMPVANPIGFNMNRRGNGNNVDINRDFPSDTNITDDLQEETKIIMGYLKSAGPSDLFINLHRMFFRDGYMCYTLTNDDGLNVVANKAMQTVSRKWQKEYEFFPQDDNHKFAYTARTLNSTLNGHAHLYGHRSLTLEHVEEIQWQDEWSRYDDLTILTGEELLVNMLKIIIQRIMS